MEIAAEAARDVAGSKLFCSGKPFAMLPRSSRNSNWLAQVDKMNSSPAPYHQVPFTSAHSRARIVKILLIVGAIAAGMSLVAETISLAVPPFTEDQELGDNPAALLVSLLIFLLGLLEFFIYITTVVFFLMWLYRAANNLRAFNPGGRTEYTPGFAVGSFFIPFANLAVPYWAVKEVWKKSSPPAEAHLSGTPGIFPAWWTFWLLSAFANNISFRVAFNENIPPSTAAIISIVAGVLNIAASFFAYEVVDAIDKKQEETRTKVNLGQLPGPPPPPNLSMPDVVAPAS